VIYLSNLFSEGIVVTIIGMGTVFSVLILLWLVLELMKKIFDKVEKQEQTTATNSQQEQTFDFMEEREKSEEINDEELITVLTAAVAASLNQSTYNLKVTSFRRVNNVSPIWNTVGRQEQLETRL